MPSQLRASYRGAGILEFPPPPSPPPPMAQQLAEMKSASGRHNSITLISLPGNKEVPPPPPPPPHTHTTHTHTILYNYMHAYVCLKLCLW